MFQHLQKELTQSSGVIDEIKITSYAICFKKNHKDLANCDFVEIEKIKIVLKQRLKILDADIEKEFTLDEKDTKYLDSQAEEIEYLNADRRQLLDDKKINKWFWCNFK